MNDEAKSHWTIEAIKEYFLKLIEQHEKRVDQKFTSIEKAVKLANRANEKRFENTNEWRASYEDLIQQMQKLIQTMQRDYIPRTEFDKSLDATREKHETAVKTLSDQIKNVNTQIESTQNRKVGSGLMWVYVVSGIGLLISIIVAVSLKL